MDAARPRSVPALPALLAIAAALAPAPAGAQESAPPASAPAGGPSTPGAQAPDLAGALAALRDALGLSGFLEVRAADAGADPDVFSLGALELDVARSLGEHVQVAAALVADDGRAELAVGFVDLHLAGAPVAPRGRLPVEKGVHVHLGRFDVPFGGDWPYFAAKDRTELSAPLTTEVVAGGGYNDVGIRLLGAGESVSWTAYWVRGEGRGSAFGGRLVLAPFDNVYRLRGRVRAFELGASALLDLDGDGRTETASLALDAEYRGPLGRLRAEWARRDERAVGGREARRVRTGLHVTALLDAGSVAGVALTPWVRWDRAEEEPGAPDDAIAAGRSGRLTAGLKALLLEALALKVEVQRLLSAPPGLRSGEPFRRDAFLAQAVFAF